MPTNGTGQGFLADDWNETTSAVATHAPHEQTLPPADVLTPSPTSPAPEKPEAQPQRGLVLPDSVAVMLDTALSGDKAANGTPGADGQPRSKNLAVLVGTVRVMTTRRGDEQRLVTNLGAIEYRYELSINWHSRAPRCAGRCGVVTVWYQRPMGGRWQWRRKASSG